MQLIVLIFVSAFIKCTEQCAYYKIYHNVNHSDVRNVGSLPTSLTALSQTTCTGKKEV